MKRSRLNMFKATSMTISILGIIMILATVCVFAYIGIQGLSSKVSSNVDSGSAYDQLASLKSEYSSLNNQFEVTKKEVGSYPSNKVKNDLYNTQMQLVKANSTIGDVESALSSDLSADEVTKRIGIAANQLQITKNTLNILTKDVK